MSFADRLRRAAQQLLEPTTAPAVEEGGSASQAEREIGRAVALLAQSRERLPSPGGDPMLEVPGQQAPPAWLTPPEEIPAARLRTELLEQQRRNAEYFDLIGQMERERNTWRDLYHAQTESNHQAQIWLTNGMAKLRTALQNAVKLLNAERKEANKALVQNPADLVGGALAAEAQQMVDDYADAVRKQLHGAPTAVDGQASRLAIDEAREKFWGAACGGCGHTRRLHTLGDKHCLHDAGVGVCCKCERFDAGGV